MNEAISSDMMTMAAVSSMMKNFTLREEREAFLSGIPRRMEAQKSLDELIVEVEQIIKGE